VLHNAALILAVISAILTIVGGIKPERVPLWIALILLCVAVIVGTAA